ncbi:MAG: hypothetical protein HUJ69_02965 [Lachnospiraceae bacterium]|nr:hypothetical protein [Lachnospiraceae bacterium]
MKKKIFALAVIAICLSLFAYGTFAYFSVDDTARNVIMMGRITVELREWADEGKTVAFPEDTIYNVIPGTYVTQITEVENTGTNPAWIRLSLDKDITFAPAVSGTPDPELVQLNLNTVDWILGTDGFYYYREALEPGQSTEPLFTTISFDPAMDGSYEGSTATVEVHVYAVQAEHNGSTVWDAVGWPKP